MPEWNPLFNRGSRIDSFREGENKWNCESCHKQTSDEKLSNASNNGSQRWSINHYGHLKRLAGDVGVSLGDLPVLPKTEPKVSIVVTRYSKCSVIPTLNIKESKMWTWMGRRKEIETLIPLLKQSRSNLLRITHYPCTRVPLSAAKLRESEAGKVLMSTAHMGSRWKQKTFLLFIQASSVVMFSSFFSCCIQIEVSAIQRVRLFMIIEPTFCLLFVLERKANF